MGSVAAKQSVCNTFSKNDRLLAIALSSYVIYRYTHHTNKKHTRPVTSGAVSGVVLCLAPSNKILFTTSEEVAECEALECKHAAAPWQS